MFNKVILVGHLTKNIELRYLQNNQCLANTGIATNRRYKNKQGEPIDEVCFIDLTIFGKTAEIANQYLQKGSKTLIEGYLKLESWTDNKGEKKSRHVVIVESLKMLDSKPSDSKQTHQSPKDTNQAPEKQVPIEVFDDDDNSIPF